MIFMSKCNAAWETLCALAVELRSSGYRNGNHGRAFEEACRRRLDLAAVAIDPCGGRLCYSPGFVMPESSEALARNDGEEAAGVARPWSEVMAEICGKHRQEAAESPVDHPAGVARPWSEVMAEICGKHRQETAESPVDHPAGVARPWRDVFREIDTLESQTEGKENLR
jgi:hypothetical protein